MYESKAKILEILRLSIQLNLLKFIGNFSPLEWFGEWEGEW